MKPPTPPARRSRLRRWALRLTIGVGVLGLILGGIMIQARVAIGAPPSGERLQSIQSSERYVEGKFVNDLPRHDGPFLTMLRKFFFDRAATRRPDEPPPHLPRARADFQSEPESGLRVTWLGHSTLLIEIEGKNILIDPVFSERASPLSWAGPKRFHPLPLPVGELPPIDAVVLSHDHYDHLDYGSIMALRDRVPLFAVPLGVGSHLEAWGIAPERIIERDWWGEVQLGQVKLVATPARHFSGRSPFMTDHDKTLWAGWAMIGSERRVYYSGDTAMFPGFAEIGSRLGPFDLTLIETGAYNAMWADVHLGPEQALQAHRMVRGKVFLPVHWGTFDLALHSWTEPIERALAYAEKLDVRMVVPRPGQSIDPTTPPELVRWWPEVPWQTAEEAPVVSSGLGELAASLAPNDASAEAGLQAQPSR